MHKKLLTPNIFNLAHKNTFVLIFIISYTICFVNKLNNTSSRCHFLTNSRKSFYKEKIVQTDQS